MSRGWKLALFVACAAVALNVLFALLRATTGGSPGGPASSSYATGSAGSAAYAELLTRAGHRVARVPVAPGAAALDPGDTVVILEPGVVEQVDRAALRGFLDRGGRLVAAEGSMSWLRGVVSSEPSWVDGSVLDAHPLAPVAEVAGISDVRTAGRGAWSRTGAAVGALGNAQASILAVEQAGAGRALLLADASPLQNRYLDQADDAQLALALAGPPQRRVLFFENYHGFGASSGLAAIPTRWKSALALAAVAALVFILARARRLGPAEPAQRELAPARLEYVTSLAATLARAKDRNEALAPLRRELRRRVIVLAGLPEDAGEPELSAAARRLGLSIAALGDDAGDLEVGRAFAASYDGRRRVWKV